MNKIELELYDLSNNKSFFNWLKILAPNDNAITKENIIELMCNGYCEDLAIYLYYKFFDKVKIILLQGTGVNDNTEYTFGHYVIKYEDMYYDSLTPMGNKNYEMLNSCLECNVKDFVIELMDGWNRNQLPLYYNKAIKNLGGRE